MENNAIEDVEVVDSVDGFFSEDVEDFTQEFLGDKEEGNEYEQIDLEADGLADDMANAADEDVAIMLLGLLDESRAIMASLHSGRDKEKYLFYKNLNRSHYMVKAGGRVVAKYKALKSSPEAILVIGLAVSSLHVMKTAQADKIAQEEAEKRAQQARHEAPPQPPPRAGTSVPTTNKKNRMA